MMDIIELKQQVLSAIDSSSLRALLPQVCERVRTKLETSEASESDREVLDLLLDFFRSPDEWLDRIAEHPSTKAIEEFLASGNSQ